MKWMGVIAPIEAGTTFTQEVVFVRATSAVVVTEVTWLTLSARAPLNQVCSRAYSKTTLVCKAKHLAWIYRVS